MYDVKRSLMLFDKFKDQLPAEIYVQRNLIISQASELAEDVSDYCAHLNNDDTDYKGRGTRFRLMHDLNEGDVGKSRLDCLLLLESLELLSIWESTPDYRVDTFIGLGENLTRVISASCNDTEMLAERLFQCMDDIISIDAKLYSILDERLRASKLETFLDYASVRSKFVKEYCLTDERDNTLTDYYFENVDTGSEEELDIKIRESHLAYDLAMTNRWASGVEFVGPVTCSVRFYQDGKTFTLTATGESDEVIPVRFDLHGTVTDGNKVTIFNSPFSDDFMNTCPEALDYFLENGGFELVKEDKENGTN